MNSQNIIKAIQNGGNNPCPKSGEFEFGLWRCLRPKKFRAMVVKMIKNLEYELLD
jgi:hypothetical protein